MITEKKVQWIECEGCHGSFDSDHIHHYENEQTHWEADLCDECADKLAAKYEI